MEIVIDRKGDTKHEYFTRSKKKIVKKETNEKVKKSEKKEKEVIFSNYSIPFTLL